MIGKSISTGSYAHCNLKLSQIKKETTMVDGKMINSYIYQEFGSKNNQGEFSSLNLQNKKFFASYSELAIQALKSR